MSLSTLLYSILRDVLRIGGPILITIGTTSCILNVIVFGKSSLRKNPCAICLITTNIVNFLYFYLGLFLTILATGYNIDPSSTNINFCRFRSYAAWVLTCWQSSCLILASIDRLLITSPNARIRKYSTCRLIVTSLISIGLFWILFHIHALIFANILQLGSNYFVCYYETGTYATFVTYFGLIITGSLSPLLMIIFGILTVKNVRRVHRVPQHSRTMNTTVIAVGRSFSVHSKDRQLIRMLLVDIIAFVICKYPAAAFLMYQEFTKNYEKSGEQRLIEQSIIQLAYFIFFIDSSITCYINILVSKTFRTELKRTLSNIFHFCFHLTN